MINVLILLAALNVAPAHAGARCPFMLDTAAILSNRNLPPFIKSLERDTFSITNDLNTLPPFITEEIECLLHDVADSLLGTPVMANCGDRYSNTCIVEKGIPFRGLTFLAMSRNVAVITYEAAGIGTPTHLLLIRFDRGEISDIWGGFCVRDLGSPRAIGRYLRRHMREREILNTRRLLLG